MTITDVKIRGLFHLYNYNILFSGDSLVSVITGPNGYGKTTILTMLDHLAHARLYYFYMLPFDSIHVGLSDGSAIDIVQEKINSDDVSHDDNKVSQELTVRFVWIIDDVEIASFHLTPKLIRETYRKIAYRLPYEHRSGLDIRSVEFSKVVMGDTPFYEFLARSQGQDQFLLRLNSLSIVFIPANRIYKNEDEGEEAVSPLKKASAELQETLKHVQYDYYYTSQQSDSELMETLLQSQENFEEEEYNKRSQAISEFMNGLAEFGFMGKPRLQPYNVENKRILSTYLVEIERKLQVYRPIMSKLTLFSDMLKNKCFADKAILVSPNFGIRARLNTGENVDLDLLSSGEKNEIMLLYRFIFTVPDNSTLLLDEPENSLHVVWQRMLIEDILRIAPAKNLQVIIATHSSRIVTRAKKYTSDLYYLNNQHE